MLAWVSDDCCSATAVCRALQTSIPMLITYATKLYQLLKHCGPPLARGQRGLQRRREWGLGSREQGAFAFNRICCRDYRCLDIVLIWAQSTKSSTKRTITCCVIFHVFVCVCVCVDHNHCHDKLTLLPTLVGTCWNSILILLLMMLSLPAVGNLILLKR